MGQLGQGTRNLSSNVPTDFYNAVAALAEKNGMSTSAYVKAVLEWAVERQIRVERKSTTVVIPSNAFESTASSTEEAARARQLFEAALALVEAERKQSAPTPPPSAPTKPPEKSSRRG